MYIYLICYHPIHIQLAGLFKISFGLTKKKKKKGITFSLYLLQIIFILLYGDFDNKIKINE